MHFCIYVIHINYLSLGIDKLIMNGTFLAYYPLHDGNYNDESSKRSFLHNKWAALTKFWKYQPLHAVKSYFGVKIGLYFTWLGFYTSMLVPPSIVGIACFIYALKYVYKQMSLLNQSCFKTFLCLELFLLIFLHQTYVKDH